MSVRYGLHPAGSPPRPKQHAPAPSCPRGWVDPYPKRAAERRRHPKTAADERAILAAVDERLRRFAKRAAIQERAA